MSFKKETFLKRIKSGELSFIPLQTLMYANMVINPHKVIYIEDWAKLYEVFLTNYDEILEKYGLTDTPRINIFSSEGAKELIKELDKLQEGVNNLDGIG